jgi:hypothetical protein
VGRFRELAPDRPRISIQRWSLRRLRLTVGVALSGLIVLSLTLGLIQRGIL